jgi:hypothetical protein
MNYELAKQLWEGGYPFKRRGDAVQFMCACTKDVCEGPLGREFRFEGNLYPEPTLSELIEACGDRFIGVYKAEHSQGWNAGATGNDADKTAPSEYGSIPEESVAKLWLALHK